MTTIHTATDADQLIARSVSHSEIVTAPWTEECADDLADVCEDSVTCERVTEYWGTTAGGDDWRVRLAGVVVSAQSYVDHDDSLEAARRDRGGNEALWVGGDEGERSYIVITYATSSV